MNPDDETVSVGLARGEHVVIDQWLGAGPANAVRDELRVLRDAHVFEPAGVGGANHRVLNRDVRQDRVHWFDRGDDERLGTKPGGPVGVFLARIDQLMAHLNATCFLSLQRIECHAACFEEGGFYAAHKDAFTTDARRVISYCYYLNDEWSAASGGCLRLHGNVDVDVAPLMDRLVVFLSADQIHEVLPTAVTRLSLTGWMSRARPP